MPNGDLHIDFRKAEVADTVRLSYSRFFWWDMSQRILMQVCRINARVHINGVGSVLLSWYSGKKP